MGEVPGIYWFVFWCAVVVISFTMAWLGGRAAHQQKMKALEILRIYAERGVEPPASVAGPILNAMDVEAHEERKWKSRKPDNPAAPDALPFVFIGLGGLAVAWWRGSQGGQPEWVFYGAIMVAVFFGGGGIAGLITKIFSRRG